MTTLFDKTQHGSLKFKNRFVRAAVGEDTKDGKLTNDMLILYEELAKGGVGSIITGFTLVDEAEKTFPLFSIYDDSFLEGHKKLVDLVHKYETNIVLQIVYIGSYVMGKDFTKVLAPSAVENLNTKVVPEEITIEEIKKVQQKFGQAALRAKKAGYDAVEIHGAHGFLLSQFMTPHYNRQTDIYGGSAENRSRMLLETYDEIRKAVGNDFPIWVKINVNDGFENEVKFEDCLYLCKKLTEKGINAIEISGSFIKYPKNSTSFFKKEAETIAKENNIPIILTGGNRSFEEMTQILNSTKIQYFGMARPLIEDPNLINEYQKNLK
jgi:2,4-dienoyl-CoA reductase-like NADH-dependent reductase (Old Yellow Enzyme family)